MRRRSQTISFRLPPPYDRFLAEHAARRGLTPGTFSRSLVMEALADARWVRLFEETAEIRRASNVWRQEFRAAVVALLCDAGKATREEALAFVERELPGSGSLGER
jgi:hypothetical protein